MKSLDADNSTAIQSASMLQWMAPDLSEIYCSHKMTDVYSFGAFTYEVATGYMPYAPRSDCWSHVKVGLPKWCICAHEARSWVISFPI